MQNPATLRCKTALLNMGAAAFLVLVACLGAFGQYRPQTIQQIHKLVAEKNTRTPAERKISSQLLQAIREAEGKPMAEGVPLKPAEVGVDSTGGLQVDVSANVTPPLLASIQGVGGKIIYPSAKYHTIRVKAGLNTLRQIAAINGVKFIKPAAKAHIAGGAAVGAGLGGGMPQSPTFKQRAAAVTQQLRKYLMMPGTGAATSQGDHTMGADSARQAYGYQGQGVRIAVLSDSYNSRDEAAADVATGDLPGPGNPFGDTTAVTVLQDYYAGTDEGRAMLQIVHDLAPKAQLFFATAEVSEASFADNILALRQPPYNCDIIIDDVIYYDEPSYQDGIVAQAVNTVTASGALYFSSAGNGGSQLMNYASIWEGDFNDAGSPQFAGDTTKTGNVHNFGTVDTPAIGDSILNLSEPFFSSGSVYTLKWADPLGGSTNDYDLFIVDGQGNVKLASTNIQDGSQDPYEEIDIDKYLNYYEGNQLVVFKSDSAKPVAFVINSNMDGQGIGFKYTTPGVTYGHSGAAAAFSVAATPAPAAYPGIFTAKDQVEYFSSDGPRHIFFNADSTPVTPGNFLISTGGGTVRKKPDITAADGVSTTFPLNYGLNPFYGTSAAAPHAAAVAALLKSANPSISPQQIRTLLTGTALDIEAPGYDYNSGYGIVRAFSAMKALNPKPLPSLALGTITVKEAAFSNQNGVVDPGEAATMTVRLLNRSLANATNVRAVLSTVTAGVTVTQDSAYYGSIAQGGAAGNYTSPFEFTVSPQLACGTKMVFIISAICDSAGLNAWSFTDTLVAGAGVLYSISSVLGQTPPSGAGYTSFSGQQKGNLNQNNYPSNCIYQMYNPGLLDTTDLYQFDAYTFTNTKNTPECITVSVNYTSQYGYSVFSTTYDSLGMVPANPSLNFKAYAGLPNPQMQYGFSVQPGEKFTVVVNNVIPGPAAGTSYTLAVSYTYCAATPPCTAASITSPVPAGATGKAYRLVLKASGGSGAYQFAVAGVLPPGLYFAGDSLYGTPTQAGSFPLLVSLTDPLSCNVNTSVNDTLVIAGVVPDSIVAYSGSLQQVAIRQPYPNVLKAKVFGQKRPLAGVRVTFVIQGSAANGNPSGAFAGGVDTVNAITDSLGIAASPAITADSIAGGFDVVASVGEVARTALFSLTNTCLATMVTNSNDDGPGSLRFIVQNACPGASVTFAPGISNITLTSGQIHIFNSINIAGPGANQLTISGNNNDIIFRIAPLQATDSISISGITFTNGGAQQYPYNAFGGGAIYINQGGIALTGCTIVNCNGTFTGSEEGGAVFIDNGRLAINNCTLANNTATDAGGAIAFYNAAVNVSNSTITGNTVTGATDYYSGTGGGIFVGYGSLSMVNCTVYGNTASIGGNVFVSQAYYPPTVTFKNSIFGGGVLLAGLNSTGPDLVGSNFTSLGYNLIQDTSAAYTFLGGLTPWDIKGLAPNLLPLANYGGPTPTLLPAPTSPVINKGDLLLTPSQLDQRGYTRVAGVRADIGAVEASYNATATAGTPQTEETNKPFATPLQTTVTENGNATAGIAVIYNAPADTVATAIFANGAVADTAVTNAAGMANAPVTANGKTGIYKITGYISPLFGPANFYLTNTKTLAADFGPVTAEVVNCAAQVNWQALSPATGETFTVQHSTDGINYTALYAVPAGTNGGAQTFHYTHQWPAVGANYYRIMETNANGMASYSHTVTVVNTCSSQPVVAYPNPTQNILSLVLPNTGGQAVSIYNAAGRLMARYPSVAGLLKIDASRWAAGIYNIVVATGGKTTCTLSFVKG